MLEDIEAYSNDMDADGAYNEVVKKFVNRIEDPVDDWMWMSDIWLSWLATNFLIYIFVRNLNSWCFNLWN